MKKLLTLGTLVLLSLVGLGLLTSQQEQKATAKNKFVLFGNVDTSDKEDEVDTEVEADQESEEGWFENFVQNHKTPFSKTIEK